MKTKFPGYFKLSEDEILNLWDNALFTLDANILLNLYRYSDETKTEFIKILRKLKERIWIPNQSAHEFFENRLNVISQQEKSYEETISALNNMESEFKSSRQHPFLSKRLLKRFSTLTKEMCDELNENKDFHSKRIQGDDILEEIESLFANKVGDEFTEKELEEIVKLGESRFAKKIPPGYKDNGKKDNSPNDIRKYGDLLVWKQIMNKSKELKKAVILVTDDRKEDWWVRFKGKTLQPRPELTKEFRTETEQAFHMYQSDRFLEFARDYLNEKVNQKTIDEIRELRRLDEEKRHVLMQQERAIIKQQKIKERLLKERYMFEHDMDFLSKEIKMLEHKLHEKHCILEDGTLSEEEQKEIFMIERQLMELQSKRNHILHRMKDIEYDSLIEREVRKKTLPNNKYRSFG
uniref:PIN-like domain-containing protein n=1 Tax=uncultured Draconibacterium sp. TaxID=1573823 RepID=UPI0032168CFA